MTPQQIDALTPGRKLDALVSREVFDQCPHTIPVIKYTILWEDLSAQCNQCNKKLLSVAYIDNSWKCADVDGWSCPDYSTDLNAAFKVVEQIVNPSTYFDLSCFYGANRVYQIRAIFSNETNTVLGEAIADSAGLAICRAALKLLRSKR